MPSNTSTISPTSFTDATLKKLVREQLFQSGVAFMDTYSRRNHYSVYEYTDLGIVNTHTFLSKNAAYDFVHEFCEPSSKVYVFKTKCIRSFDPRILSSTELESDDEDPTYVPDSADEHNGNDIPEEYDSHDDSGEQPSLEGMFFRKYGKGFLLTPPSNSEYFGEKYFIDGWWMPTQNSWFFKEESWELLEELGATFVSKRKGKSASRSTKSKSSIRVESSGYDFSGMSFTKYGKGYILTTDETDQRFGTKYLTPELTNGGFWNNNANGWFFHKSHFDLLNSYGAQYIKSEDDFVTSDTHLSVKPKFVKYGKGWLLQSNSDFPYDSSLKYFENGWYIPSKDGWFFKTSDKNAFLKKFA